MTQFKDYKKYIHEHTKQYLVRLNDASEKEKMMIAYLDQKDDVAVYIKELIYQEMCSK
jgi:hypothetical protein